MQRTLLALLAATTLSAAIPAVASAQIVAPRQATVTRQIDIGVREGWIDRNLALRLRQDLAAISRLETSYRPRGFTEIERRELNRRLDEVTRRIDAERWDADRQGAAVSNRIRDLDRAIRDADRRGLLNRNDSARLTGDLQQVQRLFDQARRSGGGITRVERADLDQRLNQLQERLRIASRDNGRGGGRGPSQGDNGRGGGWDDNNGRGPDTNPGRGPDNNPGRGNDNNPGRGPGGARG